MSKIQVNEVVNHFDNGAPDFPRGATVTGVVTATTFKGGAEITSGTIAATSGTFSGAVSVGGTLTYEDVTSIDSVGIITAQSGIKVLAGGATITGNVGIASQSPVSPLDVNGTVSVKGRYVMTVSEPDMLNLGGVTASSGLGISTVRLFTSDNVRLSISSEGYVTKPYHPCFDVNLGGGPVTAGAESPTAIVYNQINLNNGNHYNTSNGRFTAPVAGIYQFWWGNIKNNLTTVVVRTQLQKNGSSYVNNGRQLRMDASSAGVAAYGDNGAITLITSLAKGDYVRVMVTAGVVYGSSNEYTYFCGNLIG